MYSKNEDESQVKSKGHKARQIHFIPEPTQHTPATFLHSNFNNIPQTPAEHFHNTLATPS